MKKVAIPLLKASLAIGLIYWLIHTKKITAEPFIKLWGTPWLTVFAFLVILGVIVINNYRWLLLLRGQKIQSDAKQTLPLTFIGLFFNLAMPGSVGGDVIKAYYIVQEQPGTKLGAATSVLMDRIVGLYAMAIIALVAVLANSSRIWGIAQFKPLVIMILALFFGFTLFFAIGFSNTIKTHAWTEDLLKKIPAGRIINRIYDAVHDFRHGKRQFLLGILLSLIVQSMNIICFYIISQNLGFQNVSLSALFFIIPLGLIATAVPVSPGGVGVGQTVFVFLFEWYGGMPASAGGDIITIYQVVQAFWSILGAVFYFSRKQKVDPNLAKVPS